MGHEARDRTIPTGAPPASSIMPLISVSHVTKHFQGPIILDDVTLDVEPGCRIGVIGRNGSGKSTLLRLMEGELEPEDGLVHRQRGLSLAYQAQELACAPEVTALGFLRRVFAEHHDRERRLRDVEERLAAGPPPNEQDQLLARLARLHDEHAIAGGWDAERRIASVLTGLGLPETAWEQPIGKFSGGERNILGLARIVLADPDVILLDEPSNHLDMDGIEWFIRYVRSSPAAIVMVSHDRHLLDATVNTIWEVERGSVTPWTGNYTDYQQQKEDALELQERQYKNQQRVIKRLEFQARRLADMARAYDDPGQAKRAKNLLRRIEQMDKVEKPQGDERVFKASFAGAGRHGKLALEIKSLSLAFGDRRLLDDADLEISYGDRVCLAGPNGSGKTTLFRSILEEGSWENLTVRVGKSAHLGEYTQFHEDALDAKLSLVEWLQARTELLYQPATELLHRFLFTRDDLDRLIGTLSGGEKSRLQMARLVHEQVNFLLLDEPTNHLDIQACEQLERMLEDFDGTLLVISHDRYFLDRLVDTVVELRDRSLQRFRGTFQEWWEMRHREARERGAGALQLHSQKQGRAERGASEHQLQYEERKARQREERRLRNRFTAVERRIDELARKKTTLTRDLEDAWSRNDSAQGHALTADLTTLETELAGLYDEWEDLGARIEAGSPED